MSIELDNPEGILGKVDAAANFVAQIRIALSVGDLTHARECVERASDLLGEAIPEIEASESAIKPEGGNEISAPEAELGMRRAMEIIQSVGTTGINHKHREANAWMAKYFPSYAN